MEQPAPVTQSPPARPQPQSLQNQIDELRERVGYLQETLFATIDVAGAAAVNDSLKERGRQRDKQALDEVLKRWDERVEANQAHVATRVADKSWIACETEEGDLRFGPVGTFPAHLHVKIIGLESGGTFELPSMGTLTVRHIFDDGGTTVTNPAKRAAKAARLATKNKRRRK